ncbi:MAG: (2Fe-2S)-binding protein [Alphaproteobacteria bacterium]|nr:MAG: (2Fe-2S)-binding protein [Alphaproteobacteria bacterium]
MIELTINGTRHRLDGDPAEPLLYILRNELGLHAAKFGCGLGQCGSCTVLVDGKAVQSCITPLAALAGRAVTTVEGLGTAAAPGVVQQAFIDEQAAQCGYCIPGMIARAEALLRADSRPTEASMRSAMRPSLCRCGTHMRILRAVRRAAMAMGGGIVDPTEPAS